MRVILLVLLSLMLATAQASAASLIGMSCPTLGESKMDTNKANLIACLYTSETNNAMIWKALSTINSGCTSGQAVVNITNGTPVCGAVSSEATPTKLYQCPNYPIGSPYASCSCPWQALTTSIISSTCRGQMSSSPTTCAITHGNYCSGYNCNQYTGGSGTITCPLVQ
ncbi:MAG: hypothetical protein WC464_06125 [Bdellovibrionales bacterium]